MSSYYSVLVEAAQSRWDEFSAKRLIFAHTDFAVAYIYEIRSDPHALNFPALYSLCSVGSSFRFFLKIKRPWWEFLKTPEEKLDFCREFEEF